MKKKFFPIVICLSALTVWSCNNSGDSTTNADSVTAGPSGDSVNQFSGNNSNTMSNIPLSKDDSAFVMEAAMGGLMEVEAGTIAQQNASSQRIKDFGSMMVADHSKANDELKNLASSHGINIPTSLPADMQKHLDAMKAMKGAAFDKHYMSMMNDDHKKDIDKFQKAAGSSGDAQLKTWAQNTLPVLQKHMDSVTAIRKGK